MTKSIVDNIDPVITQKKRSFLPFLVFGKANVINIFWPKPIAVKINIKYFVIYSF